MSKRRSSTFRTEGEDEDIIFESNDSGPSVGRVIYYIFGSIIVGMAIVAFVLSIISFIRSPKNGTNGTDGTDGTDGTNGADGLNQTTLVLSMTRGSLVVAAGQLVEVNFTTEIVDTGSFHNSSYPTRMTISEDTVGYYLFQAVLVPSAGGTTDAISCALVKNNATTLTTGISALTGGLGYPNIELIYLDSASIGDYYTVSVYSGNSTTISFSNFMATFQGKVD
jgi:hypothetical protein